jgi:hypothetical protein
MLTFSSTLQAHSVFPLCRHLYTFEEAPLKQEVLIYLTCLGNLSNSSETMECTGVLWKELVSLCPCKSVRPSRLLADFNMVHCFLFIYLFIRMILIHYITYTLYLITETPQCNYNNWKYQYTTIRTDDKLPLQETTTKNLPLHNTSRTHTS